MIPKLSILIPTRNRRELLARTLASLCRQTAAPGAFEVIVASDGSTDGTPEMVRALAQSPEWAGRALRCVEQEWKGASAARNAALHAALGEIVLYLDDDTLAGENLVQSHLDRHAAGGDGPGLVVLGKIIPEERPEAIHRQLRTWWLDHYARLVGRSLPFNALFTANVSMPRQAAFTVGGLDEVIDYGEDIEFGYRLHEYGLRFVYEPDAVLQTLNSKSPSAVLRDLYRIGQGNVQLYHKFPASLRELPLGAYGETSMRLRLVRGLLLTLARNGLAGRAIDSAFSAWAGSTRPTGLDRSMFELARSYYFWLGARSKVKDRAEWARLSSPGVPVLMYHSISNHGQPDRYVVTTREFKRQMALLRLLGFRVESLQSLMDRWQAGELPRHRAVAITFDDGYRDNLTRAWPVLRRYRYPATLFLVTGRAGETSIWDENTGPGARRLITWDEAQHLDRAGFRIESHTVTHVDLKTAGYQVAARELSESRRQLEQELGRTVDLFAYPYGRYDEATEKAAQDAGYRAALSVRPGLNTLRTDRFALRRVTVSGDDNLIMFALKVWLGDDPLLYLPLLNRLAKRRIARWSEGLYSASSEQPSTPFSPAYTGADLSQGERELATAAERGRAEND